MNKQLPSLPARLAAFVLTMLAANAGRAAQVSHLVTSAADSGPGTLREAIGLANADTDPANYHAIGFDAALAGTTISLLTPLPPIVKPETFIDGSTAQQNNLPGVTLANGADVPIGLQLDADSGEVIGLILVGFTSAQILVNGDNNYLYNCFLGTDGTQPLGGDVGLSITGSYNYVERSLISGNGIGVQLNGAAEDEASQNYLWANVIGGDASLLAFDPGFYVEAASLTRSRQTTLPGNGIGVYFGPFTVYNLLDSYLYQGEVQLIVGSAGHGVLVDGGLGNAVIDGVVAFNGGDGIHVTGDTGMEHWLAGNLLLENGGLGLNLVGANDRPDGVTLNDPDDPDVGPNGLVNFPVIESALIDGDFLVLSGFCRPNMELEFYQAPGPGFGRTSAYLGTLYEGNAYQYYLAAVNAASPSHVRGRAERPGRANRPGRAPSRAAARNGSRGRPYYYYEDQDLSFASYSGPVDGVDQGADNAARFRFRVPLEGLPVPLKEGDEICANGFQFASHSTTPASAGGRATRQTGSSEAGSSELGHPVPIRRAESREPRSLAFIDPAFYAFVNSPIAPPVGVEVRDAAGRLVDGAAVPVTIGLESNPAGATLGGTKTVTTQNGRAVFSDLALDREGAGFTFRVDSPGLQGAVSPRFDCFVGPPVKVVFGQQPSNVVAGQTMSPAVTVSVLDADNQPLPDVEFDIQLASLNSVSGYFESFYASTTNGTAVFDALAFYQAGRQRLSALAIPGSTSIGSARSARTQAILRQMAAHPEAFRGLSDTFTVNPGPVTSLRFRQEPSNTLVGQPIEPPVVVEFTDDYGNAAPLGAAGYVDLELGYSPTPATLTGGEAVSLPAGATEAVFPTLALDAPGDYFYLLANLRPSPPPATPQTSAYSRNFSVSQVPSRHLRFLQQPSDTAVGVPIVPAVQVGLYDGNDQLLTGATDPVTLVIGDNPGGAVIRGQATVAAVNGVATFDNVALDRPGTDYTLEAMAQDALSDESDPFDVALHQTVDPAQSNLTADKTTAAANGAEQVTLTIDLVDDLGRPIRGFSDIQIAALKPDTNPAPGQQIQLAGPTDANGRTTAAATSTWAGPVTYVATAGGVPINRTATVDYTPGAPARLGFKTQPSNTSAGAPITPAVQVAVLDAFNNLVTGATNQVSLSLLTALLGPSAEPAGEIGPEAIATPTLSGTTTVTAVNGVATFAGLSVDKEGGYQLSAASPNLTSNTSNSFQVSRASGRKLSFLTQPQDTTAGQALPAVQVELTDTVGNTIIEFTGAVTVSIGTGPDGATLGGTTTANAVNGVATFDTLVLTRAGTGYTLAASSPDVAGASSQPFAIRPGAPLASASTFAADPTSVTADGQETANLVITLLDAFANPVPGVEASRVGLSAANPPADLQLQAPQGASNAQGRLTGGARRTRPGLVTFTATFDQAQVGQPVGVTFNPRRVSAERSEISLSPANVAADGKQEAVVSLILRDAGGVPVVGSPVSARQLVTDPGHGVNLANAGQDSDDDGRCALRVTVSEIGKFRVFVRVAGVDLGPVDLFGRPFVDLALTAGIHFVGLPGTPDAESVQAALATPGLQFALWNAALQQYLAPPASRQTSPIFGAGQGVWIKAAQATTLRFTGALTPAEPFRIPLRKGWNAAANPYLGVLGYQLAQIKVLVGDSVVGNLSDQSLWATTVRPYGWLFESSASRNVLAFDSTQAGFETAVAAIPPFAGIWFNALRDDVTLELSPNLVSSRSRQAGVNVRDWTVDLTATAGGSRDGGNVFGLSSSITRALEVEDPPVAEESAVALSFVTDGRARLAGEVRPYQRGQQTWRAEVVSQVADEVVLTWPGLLRQLPRGVVIELIDEQTGQSLLLNTHSAYRYQATRAGETRQFRLVSRVGNVQRTTITDLRVTPSRSAGTTLTLTLSGPGEVTLTVRGLGGRLVKSLSQQVTEAGTVTLGWDGTDQEGRKVPRGSYVVEATAISPNGALSRAVRTVTVR